MQALLSEEVLSNIRIPHLSLTGSKNGFYTASAGKLLSIVSILRRFLERDRIGLVKNGSFREFRKRHGTGNEVDRNFNSRFGGFEKRIWD